MKLIFVLVVFLVIPACVGGDGGNEGDVTGTWKFNSERKEYSKDTGEYVGSFYSEGIYLFEDTGSGVKYKVCWSLDEIVSNALLEDDFLYFGMFGDDRYKLQNDGSYRFESELIVDESDIYDIVFERSLSKVSDDFLIDHGSFIINGSISSAELSHVCVVERHYNVTGRYYKSILTKYEDGLLHFTLSYENELAPGIYKYENDDVESAVKIHLDSTSEEFSNKVGNSSLSARDITIEIHESSDERIIGSYSMTGQDDGYYWGDFEIVL